MDPFVALIVLLALIFVFALLFVYLTNKQNSGEKPNAATTETCTPTKKIKFAKYAKAFFEWLIDILKAEKKEGEDDGNKD